jgi:formin 2/WAS/WASL-interacting protein
MGFMDKAKKMAEQAQAKLDEAQKQFNAGQRQDQGSGPAAEYDQHGRPVAQPPAETATPPHGDPVAGSSPPPPFAGSTPPPVADAPAPPVADAPPVPGPAPTSPAAAAPTPPPAPPSAPSAQPTADAPDEDRNHPSYAPPKLTSGDPLAG